KIPLSGSAGNGQVQRRIQNHLGLLERRQLMKVAHELEESHIPRQIRFAAASKHSQVGLEQLKYTLLSRLVAVATPAFLPRMINKITHIACQGSRSIGRMDIETAAPLPGDSSGL